MYCRFVFNIPREIQMNIVIIEQNKIYRESLKTALDQIPDFKVVFDTDNIVVLKK